MTTNFSALGLHQILLQSLAKHGFETPTPIQAGSIPHVIEGRDLLGIAQTGTGKTAAFALPLLHRLFKDPRRVSYKHTRVLVLSPTRELASQITATFRLLAQGSALKIVTVFGGMPMGAQKQSLAAGVDVLVATPGRLLDHMSQGTVSLSEVEAVVLDEADQMLDMGFIQPLKKIVSALPRKRQGLFFSATMPPAIRSLAETLLTDPVEVAVTPISKTADKVEQRVIHVSQPHKRLLLVETLRDTKDMDRALVFSRTKHGADKLVTILTRAGLGAAALHGNKTQAQRTRALAGFKDGSIPILVATDIAARGIHVDNVSHVINYDMPNIAESYVHRIGRTARAGAAGIAISFVDDSEKAYLKQIERLIGHSIFATSHKGGELPAELAAPAPREQGRGRDGRSFEGRSESRGEGRRFEGRSEGRGEGRGPRNDGRSFEGRGGPRGERSARGFEGRGEGRSFEGRGEGRGFEGRGEGRGFEPRGERGFSGERRFSGERKPAGERGERGFRHDGRGERPVRAEGRGEGRGFEGRGEGRSFEGRGRFKASAGKEGGNERPRRNRGVA